MPEELYTCDVCGNTEQDRDYLAEHMIRDHAQKTIEIGEGEEK